MYTTLGPPSISSITWASQILSNNVLPPNLINLAVENFITINEKQPSDNNTRQGLPVERTHYYENEQIFQILNRLIYHHLFSFRAAPYLLLIIGWQSYKTFLKTGHMLPAIQINYPEEIVL